MVAVETAIRRNADGEIRVHSSEVADRYIANQPSWWGDGNGSCDCNRWLFFEQAGDPDFCGLEDEDDDWPCGHTAYTVLSVTRMDTGRVIYSDPRP